MLRTTLLAAAALTAAAAFAPATAQSLCGDRTQVLKHLSQGYGESAIGMGIAANGAVLEVMTSDAGSWTILVTLPSGATCIVATGENWESLQKVALQPGQPGI